MMKIVLVVVACAIALAGVAPQVARADLPVHCLNAQVRTTRATGEGTRTTPSDCPSKQALAEPEPSS